MPVRIDFVGTEAFYTRWSGTPADKIEDIKDFCQYLWRRYIHDGSIHYDADFYCRSRNQVEIPDSEFLSASVGTRLRTQRDWLDQYWSGFNGSDAIVVMDYCNAPNQYGNSVLGSAGTPSKIATVNLYPEDNGRYKGEFRQVRSEGVAQHELCHLFSSDHPCDVSTLRPQEASIMYHPHHGIGCRDIINQSPDLVGRWHSPCAVDSVRNFIKNSGNI